jgi:hypothetical protein
MKDNATGAVKVTYFSNCLGNGPMVQTNKCDGLKVGTVVNFTARIEVKQQTKDCKCLFVNLAFFFSCPDVRLTRKNGTSFSKSIPSVLTNR